MSFNQPIRIWLDAQLSPALAPWISQLLDCEVQPIRDIGLRDATDAEIFRAARQADVVLITKDSDFSHLIVQHGAPPRVIWLKFGNTSNHHLKEIFRHLHPRAMEFILQGESLVEMPDPFE